MKIINVVKKSIFCFLFLSTVLTLSAQEKNSKKNVKANPNAPEITFEKTVYTFGSVLKNSDCKTEFAFKNTGKSPLILFEVKPSCDCTTPSWTKEPILPGKTGVIKVVYDTKETGVFSKTISVSSNAHNKIVELTIQGEVYE